MSVNLSLPGQMKAEEEKDVLGGGGVLDSGVYSGTVELVYLDKSEGGALSVNIHFKAGDRVVRNTTYISNKAGEFTYKDKDGEQQPLPGYNQMNAFFNAVTGKGIDAQETEEKTIKLYDWEQKAEVPVKRQVFVDALGKDIAIGILKVSEEKTTKESGYKDGTGEYRDSNVFDKYFDAETGMTTVEKRDPDCTEAAFIHDWKKKNDGQIRVKKAKNSGAAAGQSTGAAPGAGAPAKSLFS